jgi:hypothetical protein
MPARYPRVETDALAEADLNAHAAQTTSAHGGILASSDVVLLPNGTSAAPALSFAAEPNSGIYRAGNGDFRFVTAGTTRATWTGGGIGSSSGFQLTGASSQLIWTALSAAATVGLAIKVSGDANNRLHIRADGAHLWGDGTAVQDIMLKRLTSGSLTVRDAADAADRDLTLRTVVASGIIQSALGAVGSPSYTFIGDTNTGIYSPTADELAVSLGGTRVLHMTAGATSMYTAIDPLVMLRVGSTGAQGFNTTSQAYGISTNVTNSGLGSLVGVVSNPVATSGSAGTVGQLVSYAATWRHASTALVTSAYCFKADPATISVGSLITTAYGLHIGKMNAVGVGTAYGIFQADAGDINRFFGQVQVNDGSAAAPALSFLTDATRGIYSYGGNAIGFATAGAYRGSIDLNGMTIVQNINLVGSNSALGILYHTSTANIAFHIKLSAEANARFRVYSDGDITWGDGTAVPDIMLKRGSATALSIRDAADTADRDLWARTITSSGVIQPGLGTVALPSYTFNGDTDTGMYSPTADQLAFATAGAARLTISTVGTITVNAQIRSQANGSAAAPVYSWANDVDTGMYNPSGDLLVFATGATDRLRLDAGGSMLFGASVTVGDGGRVIGIQNAAVVPTTNPVSGGTLYAEAGALKWRGSSGTITTLAVA